ncbi:glycosyltransferase family 2 protein [Aequorivita todarodis]|uniref:glycosyltransferase family 2 protein n=1 Tax=Aequorivita todarodis TaxID=2036821 RepID=UPI002350815B|nr:glycosyltransferase family 2 protein [Aequorivita todarodis]MDC8001197.1 glycosyltransferase family 2 protein [Aequorivita todarodis]
MMNTIAVLLTCHNRKEKTLQCLQTLFKADVPETLKMDYFLVDDGCTDGTGKAVKEIYPEINIILGNGNLFWAGGMRLAFNEARKHRDYDGYLLLNDDVELTKDFLTRILETQEYCLNKYKKGGLYSGSTKEKRSGKISYGGNVLTNGIAYPAYKLVQPSEIPQPCHLTNANILYVEKEVIDAIGFFDTNFSHAFADYDFSLRAFKAGFPVYITPGICGYCKDDHGNNWSSSKKLKHRIAYLKSPTGLAYKEYLYYGKRHFPKQVPKMFLKLWAKTLFPSLWDLKNK